jgi:hypothetical protein
MAYTNFLKPTSVTQTTASSEISWNLDTSPYNVSTGCGTTEPLTSFSSKSTGLLIFSGWDATVVPPNNGLDGVFVDAFSVSARETDPQGMTFNNDGTVMYICGKSSDKIIQYQLTTAWDISTASYTTGEGNSHDIQPNIYKAMAVQFNADGTKVFVLDETSDDVSEFTLSVAFDISSTVTYVDAFSVATQETKPTGLAFNTDGTKMFICGWKGNDVNEYALTTGFDVSTASYVQRFAAAVDLDTREVKFNTDGTVMFLLGRGGAGLSSVYRFTLTTGFDVSTASFEDSYDVKGQETAATSMAFSTDGTKMFVLGNSSPKNVSEYTLATAFDFSPVTTTVDGIEVKVLASKRSRIEDSIVQLAQSGSVIGTNQAITGAGNDYTYGDITLVDPHTWDATLAYSDLPSLQVAVKYTSDDKPHSDTAYVYSVQLKIHYT